ncbi:MAG: hypothetical protein LBI19_02855 [Oscillospiraceae bacterium]|jgi:ribosomal protein S27E|nr:hypothetical protein [Oscillospiraceae bacterium]
MNLRNKPTQAEKPAYVNNSRPYYLNGENYKVRLTGDEFITTICPDCSAEHTVDSDTFIEIEREDGIYMVEEDGIFGATVRCEKCSAKQNA